MTREDIIRMARKVWGESAILPFDDLERFAALVAAQEREECANLCEDNYEDAILGANAIRKRGIQ